MEKLDDQFINYCQNFLSCLPLKLVIHLSRQALEYCENHMLFIGLLKRVIKKDFRTAS